MWLAMGSEHTPSLCWGAAGGPPAPGSTHDFPTMEDLVLFLQSNLPMLEGVAVFGGPGRLSLVRGTLSLAMGLAHGRRVPVLSLSLRDLLKLGWPSPGPAAVVCEPVRQTVILYQRSASGRVTRKDTAQLPQKTPVFALPSAQTRFPGVTPIPQNLPSSLLQAVSQIPKDQWPGLHPSRHIEYARAAV